MNTSEKWVEDFDKYFEGSYGTGFSVMQMRIKAFISDNFVPTSKIREVVSKIQGMKNNERGDSFYKQGFNAAISSILKMLNELK